MTRRRWRELVWPSVAVAAAFAVPAAYGGNAATLSIATECLIYAVAAASLNLLMGYGGQVSLGHAGFLAVGAYTAAIVAIHLRLPLVLEILAAGVVAAAIGFVLGLPTGRLRGLYLVILTLGFGVAVPQIALNWTTVTNGWAGLAMPPTTLFGLELTSQRTLYYYVLAVSGLCLLAMLTLVGTRTGRIFMAVRDSEAAATAMGINVWRAKVRMFATSAFFCGIAGDLLAHWTGLVAPTSFPFDLSLLFFSMVVVGGMASIWGTLAGTVLLVLVEDVAAGVGGLSTAIIGGAVVLTLLAAPEGLASLPRALFWRLRRMRTAEAPPPAGRPSARHRTDGHTGTRGVAVLELSRVSLSFGGLKAIADLDLRVPDRSICSLIGPNGAGKTSVLNVVSRYYAPQAGAVRYNGHDLLTLPPHRVVETGIARSFQSPTLFKRLSVFDNLLIGAAHLSKPTVVEDVLRLPRSRRHERRARERADRALEFLALTAVRHRVAGDLPYGHQKLVDVGRALVADPSLLLLDEPAAGMEEGLKHWLADLLVRVPGEYGAAVLLIDHDMSLVLRVSDNAVVMNFGSKIFDGPPALVRHHPQVLAAYLGAEHAEAGRHAET